ncbi:hypothetical protein LCGC14_0141850 [marine sediment metagenome]|uniref:Methyltransferase FkbM domain-containing protein n=1 Tax=marine sediment metagenome TaxID=412755 RepID=A0A0F9V140_9ZZZZ
MDEHIKTRLQLDRCSRYLFFAKGILPPEPIFIDIGSRTGIHAIALDQKFSGTTIVYEANEENCHLLNQAVFGSKIITRQLAVTGEDGEIDFFEFPGGCSHSIYPRHKKETSMRLTQRTKVKSTSVESILKTNDIPRIDVLFCNCEGAELEIINEIMRKPDLRNKIGQLCVSFHGGRIYPEAQTTDAIKRMSEFFLMTTETNDWPCHLFVNKNII